MSRVRREGVFVYACRCQRQIEAHTLSLTLSIWIYQHLRRTGGLEQVDIRRLRAVLGVTNAQLNNIIAHVYVNANELALNLHTSRSYMDVTKIPLPIICDRSIQGAVPRWLPVSKGGIANGINE
jgi:hypothetical protein